MRFVVFSALLSVVVPWALADNLPNQGVTEYSQKLLQQINLYRRENGLKQLWFDPILLQLAKKHSTEMCRRNMLDHHNFNARFKQAHTHLCVENVGWNYSSPQGMFDGWRLSNIHNQNMLHEEINRVGIAEAGEYVTFFACK